MMSTPNTSGQKGITMFPSTYTDPQVSYEAGLTGLLDGLISDADTLIKAVVVVIGTVIAIAIIMKNPTFGRALIGVGVGAFVASLPWLIPAVGGLFREDIEASPAVVVVDEDVVAAAHEITDTSTPYTLTL